MKTGNTRRHRCGPQLQSEPQWSPVMKTGNTSEQGRSSTVSEHASMEPGHEDREYCPTSS